MKRFKRAKSLPITKTTVIELLDYLISSHRTELKYKTGTFANPNSTGDAVAAAVWSIYSDLQDMGIVKHRNVSFIFSRVSDFAEDIFLYHNGVSKYDKGKALEYPEYKQVQKELLLSNERLKLSVASRRHFAKYFTIYLGIGGSILGAIIGAWATLRAMSIIKWPF